MPDAVLPQADDLRPRQHHLDVGVLFGREPAELLHGSLLVDLVLFLHSDSLLFLAENYLKATTPSGVRVATSYELMGIFTDVAAVVSFTEGKRCPGGSGAVLSRLVELQTGQQR